MLEIGMTLTKEFTVTSEATALALGSGDLDVYATPSMISLMELTARCAVGDALDEGMTTVGTLVNISHVAATPVGMTVTCTATLTEIDGRRLVFNVEANDEKGLIGKGSHERFIVDAQKFQSKTDAKLQ